MAGTKKQTKTQTPTPVSVSDPILDQFPADLLDDGREYVQLAGEIGSNRFKQSQIFIRRSRKVFPAVLKGREVKVSDLHGIITAIGNVTTLLGEPISNLDNAVSAVKATVLHEQLCELYGPERAGMLSFQDCIDAYPKALAWDLKTVSGTVKDSWRGFFDNVIGRRYSGIAVPGTEFQDEILATERAIASAKDGPKTPEQIAADEAEKAQKVKATKATQTRNTAVRRLNALVTEYGYDRDRLWGLLLEVFSAHAMPVPLASGFSPEACDSKACRKVAGDMDKAGKIDEMRVLRNELDQRIGNMEKMAGIVQTASEVVNAA